MFLKDYFYASIFRLQWLQEGTSIKYTLIIRLAKQDILVTSSEDIERLSDTTCLCVGFHGVFTTNKFTVSTIWYNLAEHDNYSFK